jgi:hypothetical protein
VSVGFRTGARSVYTQSMDCNGSGAPASTHADPRWDAFLRKMGLAD